MKKLRLQVEELVVDSFTLEGEGSGRGTVQAYNTCVETCVDLDCSGECTTSCGTDPGTDYNCTGGTDTGIDFSCGSDVVGCRTYYDWTGCDYSCCLGPCN